MLKYSCKILDRETLNKKVEEVIDCRYMDINSFILNSEVIYSSVYDFMFKVIDIKIVKYRDKLYTINSVDSDRWIEPLLIQLNDDGSLMDYFFKEFIQTTELDLGEYFINYIDFSEIMESVRIKNSLNNSEYSENFYSDDEDDDDLEHDSPNDKIVKSDIWK